jgi:Arc/MetJ-type ribon-helix-helix transcriptional regulator
MHTTLGRSGVETLDTLIMAGIAETRADAIRWALARIRERPAYERLRERIQEIDQLRTDF